MNYDQRFMGPHGGSGPIGPSPDLNQRMLGLDAKGPLLYMQNDPGTAMLTVKESIKRAEATLKSWKRSRFLFGGGAEHWGFGNLGVDDGTLKSASDRINMLTQDLENLKTYAEQMYRNKP